MSQFANYALTIGQQKATEIGYASLGLSLEQYGVNAMKQQVPGAVALTTQEQNSYACGDLTVPEVQAGQTQPTCGVLNTNSSTNPNQAANGGTSRTTTTAPKVGPPRARAVPLPTTAGTGSIGRVVSTRACRSAPIPVSATTGGNPLPIVLSGGLCHDRVVGCVGGCAPGCDERRYSCHGIEVLVASAGGAQPWRWRPCRSQASEGVGEVREHRCQAEGGSFAAPIVNLLQNDSGALSAISPFVPSYFDANVDQARQDFAAGTTDYAVTELPLTAAETATAASQNGRSFAYVPFAASPVAIASRRRVQPVQHADARRRGAGNIELTVPLLAQDLHRSPPDGPTPGRWWWHRPLGTIRSSRL